MEGPYTGVWRFSVRCRDGVWGICARRLDSTEQQWFAMFGRRLSVGFSFADLVGWADRLARGVTHASYWQWRRL